MKLKNSVPALDNALDLVIEKHGLTKVMERFTAEYNSKLEAVQGDHDRAKVRFCWFVWHRLINSQQRDNIIAESVPFIDWQGGYAVGVNDSHIETMLFKSKIMSLII